ncbi:MAG: alkaline phosphatase family protein [Chloroflexota bacterium]
MSVLENKRPFPNYVHLFFMDGVGLGRDEPAHNPFQQAKLPHLNALFGKEWFLAKQQPIQTDRATLVPTDATLDMPGRPQSATGQATILTGRNVSRLVGEHYGPKPNKAVRAVIQENNIFQEVVRAGGHAALLTPYPQPYFDAINSGKRLLSAVPLAATTAGVSLMTGADLAANRAVSPGFTNEAWRTHLGYTDMPQLTLAEASRQIIKLAATYHFSFFEHWPSDRLGHRGPVEDAVRHLEMLDTVLGHLIAEWPTERGLLIITSDHGNIEDKSHRQHTTNPVPTVLVGADHAVYAQKIHSLVDIAAIVRQKLAIRK